MEIFRPTQKRNFACQSSVAVIVKLLMIIASKYAKVIHVIHDEVWFLAREPTETVNQIIEEFTNKHKSGYCQDFQLKACWMSKQSEEISMINRNIRNNEGMENTSTK